MKDDFRFDRSATLGGPRLEDCRCNATFKCGSCFDAENRAKASTIAPGPSRAPIELSLANAGATRKMDKKAYIEFHAACTEKMRTITVAKNADYTGKGDDPFSNFSNSETFAGVTTVQGFLVRMGDKLARLKSFSDKGFLEVKDESVEDTLLDLANYCILMAGYIKGKRDA